MKPPDLYTDWRVVAGLALIILGASNWFIGWRRTDAYGRLVAHASQQRAAGFLSFDELDASSDAGVLATLNAGRRQASFAAARMDFYHATFVVGQIMFIVGLVVTLIGFIRVIQKDTRRQAARAAPPPLRIRW